jgi:hypothetical protein
MDIQVVTHNWKFSREGRRCGRGQTLGNLPMTTLYRAYQNSTAKLQERTPRIETRNVLSLSFDTSNRNINYHIGFVELTAVVIKNSTFCDISTEYPELYRKKWKSS